MNFRTSIAATRFVFGLNCEHSVSMWRYKNFLASGRGFQRLYEFHAFFFLVSLCRSHRLQLFLSICTAWESGTVNRKGGDEGCRAYLVSISLSIIVRARERERERERERKREREKGRTMLRLVRVGSERERGKEEAKPREKIPKNRAE